jgi:drug/metabolite transporter (DMT)-like permease
VTAILLALCSAAAYGTSDFLGGLLAGRISAWRSAFAVQLFGGLALLLIALLSGGHLDAGGLGWAALSGLGTGLGVAFLYRGLAAGQMGVVAPISGVGAAVLPAVVGLLSGDHPSTLSWVGIVLALPAIYLVALGPGGESGGPAGILDGVLAGLGFGLGFTAFAQIGGGAGAWPVAVQEIVAAATVAAAALVAREAWLPRTPAAALGVVPGVLGGGANLLFLASTHHGMLTVSAVISSFYPAATVVLAVAVLRERVGRGQALGLGMCAAAVALVAAG